MLPEARSHLTFGPRLAHFTPAWFLFRPPSFRWIARGMDNFHGQIFMAESFSVDLPLDKAERYAEIRRQIAGVIEGEPDRIARLASAASLLATAFAPRFIWTGFYLVDQGAAPNPVRELVVGPYQGRLGCLRIAFGKGVCGTAAASETTLVVADVHAFPGHITCDSRSQSEIVVPVFDREGRLAAVLDVDSAEPDAFDEVDRHGLEAICAGLLVLP